MTPEEAIKELREASDSEVRYGDTDNHYDEVMKRIEAFDMAIKSLEQQPCEDWKFYYNHGYTQAKRDLARPTGKWIVCDVVKFGDFVGTEKYECSKCHHRVGAFKSNFCPNCGARMIESENKE